MYKDEFHRCRPSIRRLFKQMEKMGASGRVLIVLADESELRRRVPSSSDFKLPADKSTRTFMLEPDVCSLGIPNARG